MANLRNYSNISPFLEREFSSFNKNIYMLLINISNGDMLPLEI